MSQFAFAPFAERLAAEFQLLGPREERREIVEHGDRVGEQAVAHEIADGFQDAATQLVDRQHFAAIRGWIDVALQDLAIPEQGGAVVAGAAEDVGLGELGGESLG